MKIISWNVNGLRACLNKGFEKIFRDFQADVFCLQETKMEKGQAEIDLSGFNQYWYSAKLKGYSGTASFTKAKPLAERYGIGHPEFNREGRAITLEYGKFILVNIYTPNSQAELNRLDYRMKWEDELRFYVTELNRSKPVVICGDLNVAHTEMDIKNPKPNQRNAGFTVEEREKMSRLLDSGFRDSYREFNPKTVGAYSWWSYRSNARKNNTGWRLDYFLVSERLLGKVRRTEIFPEIFGSDHCPVGLELDI